MLCIILCVVCLCSAENGTKGSKRRFEGAQTVQCPTVTPEAGLQQIVLGQLLDILWSEVATVLEPLLVAARDRALIGLYAKPSNFL